MRWLSRKANGIDSLKRRRITFQKENFNTKFKGKKEVQFNIVNPKNAYGENDFALEGYTEVAGP